MITAQEAERIATRWVAAGAAPGAALVPSVHEFEQGYVVSARQGPDDPPLFGAGRGIIDKETGELSVWPSLPIEAVTAQYREWRANRPQWQHTWDPAEQARWDNEHVATPCTVTFIDVRPERIRARSVKGDSSPRHHRLVVDFLHNELPAEYRERGFDRCSEAAAISDALHAEDARRRLDRGELITLEQARDGLFAGASIVTYRVRETGDPVGGQTAPPCLSCVLLAQHFGFVVIPPADQTPAAEVTTSA